MYSPPAFESLITTSLNFWRKILPSFRQFRRQCFPHELSYLSKSLYKIDSSEVWNPQKISALRPSLHSYSRFTRISAYITIYANTSNDGILISKLLTDRFVNRTSWKFPLKGMFSPWTIRNSKIFYIDTNSVS